MKLGFVLVVLAAGLLATTSLKWSWRPSSRLAPLLAADGNELASMASAGLISSTDKEAMMEELMGMLKDVMGGSGLGDSEALEGGSRGHSSLTNGVVRIYCTHSPPNFGMPWQRLRQEFSTSTGFIIGGNKILTNAHAVEYGSLIQVKAGDSERKFVASAVAVGHECDLAILSVEDENFWKQVTPLEFGKLPELLDDVSVVGYPVGGDSLSITSGVVSRIEMQEYAQASAQLLAIQIDAAINPGNSGGPVVDGEDKVVGAAFQSLSDEEVENIGYVVPVNVIHHFLEDVERHGRYTGVCGLGVRLQALENEALRRYYGMGETDTGVLVLSIADTAPANSVLEVGDVLLSLDGIRISNDGKIPFRDGDFKERVGMHYHFTQKFPDDVVDMEILRKGKKMITKVQLWATERLVPRVLTSKNFIDSATNQGTGIDGSIVGGSPSYLIMGGLVFVSLGLEYLQTEFNPEHMDNYEEWGEEFKLLALAQEAKKEEGEEIVLLSQVISHSCNVGYETYRNMQLKTYNGEKVKSMKHLKQLFGESAASAEAQAADGNNYITLVFENGQVVVLEKAAAVQAFEDIASEHFIQKWCSEDLL